MKQKKFLIFNYKNNACLLKKKKKQLQRMQRCMK